LEGGLEEKELTDDVKGDEPEPPDGGSGPIKERLK
jgi:hypothetical protein